MNKIIESIKRKACQIFRRTYRLDLRDRFLISAFRHIKNIHAERPVIEVIDRERGDCFTFEKIQGADGTDYEKQLSGY